MASTRKLNTKDGIPFYEISVSRGRGVSRITTRWYPPAGWSQKAIDRELVKVAVEFEQKVKAGEVLTRQEERIESYRKELEAAQITALLLSMQAQNKSHSTVIKVYTVLQGLFKMAYLADLIDRNPMDKVQRPRPRKDEVKTQEAEAYTVEEIRHIWNCLSQEPLKWRAMIRLLIDTGIRRGECCGLQWKDVDFAKNTITICGNLCYTPDKGIYLDTPKNGRNRTIDVDPQIIALLRELRLEQSKKAISQYVFTQEGSPEPIHPQSPARYLQNFAKKYGVQGLHPHKLRHSFASIAITNGADIASVSEKLGHTDKAVTLRMYTHADQESIKRASQIF